MGPKIDFKTSIRLTFKRQPVDIKTSKKRPVILLINISVVRQNLIIELFLVYIDVSN